MAAAVVTGRQKSNVTGHLRERMYTSVRFANHGDTLQVRGIKTISQIALTPTADEAYGFTVSGNTITIACGGVSGGITFRGSIYGL